MMENGSSEPPPSRVALDRLNLLDHHLVILLVTFIETGLLDVCLPCAVFPRSDLALMTDTIRIIGVSGNHRGR
jgi:hypothetical protein